MITQTPWIERRFTFDQPIGLLPCTIERLNGLASRLTSMTAHREEPVLALRPPDGTWSVKEHIGHLYDLDELHDARIDDFLSGALELRPADILNAKTGAAGYNSRNVADIIGLFAKRRESFVKRLRGMSEADALRRSIHPRLKLSMRLADMALFCADHDDHHAAKIAALLGM